MFFGQKSSETCTRSDEYVAERFLLTTIQRMPELFDFFDEPTPAEQNVVLVDLTTPRKAEKLIESVSTAIQKAQRFPSIRSSTALHGQDPRVTDYILESAANV